VSARYHYRRWDGSQDLGDLDPDDLLAALTDDVLAGGDLGDALRRLLRSGLRRPDGSQLSGLRDLLEQARRRRAELADQGDPGGTLSEYAQRLEEILSEEASGIDELEREAHASGDQRRQEVTDDVVAERRMALDLLPDTLAGRVQSLQQYEFVSSEARQHFEELVEEMRAEIAQTYFQQASEALRSPDPAQLARVREAFDALNAMLEQRERGEPLDPGFEEFMERYGDLFPGDPESLDQLLEQLAQRMAAAQAVFQSLSPDQQAELRALAGSLLEDMDLRWQVDRLAANLARAFPDAGWERSQRFTGEGPLGLSEATDLAAQLGELDRMEELLRSATSPATLSEIDLDAVRRHLGDDAARDLDTLARLARELEEAGLIEQRGGRPELTPKGVRRMGQQALSDLFSQMARDRVGEHRTTWSGAGHDREEITKPWEPGQPLDLHLSATVHNAVRRNGAGVPVHLVPEDFEVVETEALARSATVLAVDLSMSMPMRDNFVPAKKMAMALQTLITTRFPRDYLGIVGFSEVAREIRPEELPTAMWDYVYGTNLQHALLLARQMLGRQSGTKQIIVVTDGEPTAHIEPGGEPFFSYPPIPETLERTMAEVIQATRSRITINMFVLDLERTRYPFVEQITRTNGGRAFFTSPDALGGYVLVDFLEHRRLLRPAG